jgi:hypothetical protein
MFGTASVESVSSKSADERVIDRMAAQLGQGKDDQMNPEQLAAMAKAITDGVVGALTALRKSEKDQEDAAAKAKADAEQKLNKEDPRLIFKGDLSSKEARENFVNEVRAYELRKAVADGKTADEIAAMFKALEEGEVSDEEAKIVKSDSPEVRDLKRKLAKAEKRSNQGTKSDAQGTNLSKAEEAAQEEAFALSIADAVNASRGYAVPKRA